MSAVEVTVAFRGAERRARVAPLVTLSAAARAAAVEIAERCGGRGRCRSCRVKLVRGPAPPPTLADLVQLGEEEVAEGYRLACQCRVGADLEVQVAPPAAEGTFQILTASGLDGGRLEPASGVVKRHLPAPPERGDGEPGSELERVLRGSDEGAAPPPLALLRRLPAALAASGGLTVTRFEGAPLAVEPGDTGAERLGLALDVGTTTVVAYLIDLGSGETLAVESGLNPQCARGADLISRIGYAARGEASVGELRARIVGHLNELIGAACAAAGVARERVYKVVAVGNTCMHHLLLGIDPSRVGRAPFRPLIRAGYRCPAREVGLRVNEAAILFTLPLVAGFVGADAVAMILATGLHEGEALRLAVDIGTNAEVVIGGAGRLAACSAPAGPALEGGQIRCGMRAALGAIDRVVLDGDLRVHTIGEVPARGLCGSGLLDAVAALLDAGLISPAGRLLEAPAAPCGAELRGRLRRDPRGRPEVVLVFAGEGGCERDVVLTQGDVRELQLAKAAVRCAIEALLRAAGARLEEVAELLLAGAFGHCLDPASARRIGMLPALPAGRVRQVGNAAALGAQMALLSEPRRRDAEVLARRVEHLSLAAEPDFQQRYLAALPFPEGERP